MALHSLTVGSARFRTGHWRGRADLAYLVPLSAAHTLDREALGRARAQLLARGFEEVVTAAVAPPEREAFQRDGFTDHEYLHLLRYDLAATPARTRGRRHRLARGRRRDWPAILELDAVAFDDFWRLDEDGLVDSMEATPVSRLRIARAAGKIIGYSVAGRAATQGYLQRLAVDPSCQGAGLGSTMVFDALRWMRRRGAGVAWVNTQERNERALRLYQHLGFQLETDRLTVMHRDLR